MQVSLGPVTIHFGKNGKYVKKEDCVNTHKLFEECLKRKFSDLNLDLDHKLSNLTIDRNTQLLNLKIDLLTHIDAKFDLLNKMKP